jgi:transcriptional regulator with XRE-family HTH domain
MIREHDCEESAMEYISTKEAPYHYIGSGLKNVYLVGIKYWVCSVCKRMAAEIPSLNPLHANIARLLVEKSSPLIGEQVRFLRKRIAKQSKEFAAMIGVTPERYSAMESSEVPLAEGRDKLVRIIYRVLSRDSKLKRNLTNEHQLEQWLMALHRRGNSESVIGTWLSGRRWLVVESALAACA